MNQKQVRQRIFHLLAKILEYPQADLAEAVYECETLLSLENPAAAACLREFRDFVAEISLGRLQEIYTVTFDLDATCHPYVGYHLFGESYKRSAFMLGLKDRYQTHGFTSPENELPDHLAVILRFLAVCDDAELVGEILHEALAPTLEKMNRADRTEEAPDQAGEAVKRDGRPTGYQLVLPALELTLQQFSTNDLETSQIVKAI